MQRTKKEAKRDKYTVFSFDVVVWFVGLFKKVKLKLTVCSFFVTVALLNMYFHLIPNLLQTTYLKKKYW